MNFLRTVDRMAYIASQNVSGALSVQNSILMNKNNPRYDSNMASRCLFLKFRLSATCGFLSMSRESLYLPMGKCTFPCAGCDRNRTQIRLCVLCDKHRVVACCIFSTPRQTPIPPPFELARWLSPRASWTFHYFRTCALWFLFNLILGGLFTRLRM